MASVGEQERTVGKKTNDDGYGSLTLRRIADPDELADAFLFLLGDKSTFITGTAFNVDGGLVI